jgi:hypothetical protein
VGRAPVKEEARPERLGGHFGLRKGPREENAKLGEEIGRKVSTSRGRAKRRRIATRINVSTQFSEWAARAGKH